MIGTALQCAAAELGFSPFGVREGFSSRTYLAGPAAESDFKVLVVNDGRAVVVVIRDH